MCIDGKSLRASPDLRSWILVVSVAVTVAPEFLSASTADELEEVILFRVGGQCGYHLGSAFRKLYAGLEVPVKRCIFFKSSHAT